MEYDSGSNTVHISFHQITEKRVSIMKKLSLVGQTVAIALLVIPFSSQAQSWTCKQGNNVREIHVQSESPSSPVPCSVVYKKPTEGVADKTLWNATSDASYCAEKAKAFVEKQVSLGWTCEEKAVGETTTTKTSN
jgi:hypothetical protein